MRRSFTKRPWIRVTLVVITLAAAAVVVTGEIVRSTARRRLREAILAELQPVALKNCTFKRFGSANDGGYSDVRKLDRAARCSLLGTALVETMIGDARCRDTITSRFINMIVLIPHDLFVTGANLIFHNECVGDPQTGQRASHFFDTLENQISKNGDNGRRLIIKMDIEGAEWEIAACNIRRIARFDSAARNGNARVRRSKDSSKSSVN